MTKKQMIAIISLAATALVLAGVIIGVVARDDSSAEAEPLASTTSSTSAAATTEEEAVEDPAVVLAGADVNSIHPAPAPEAAAEWGDYALHDSWDGRVRVFENSGPQEISAPGGEPFPATMNDCGAAMYYVTFRSVNDNVGIEAHLINAVDEPAASRAVNQGWSLSTNCETPAFEFVSASDTSTLGDVAYDVHEYWQSSVAPAAPQEPTAAPVTSSQPIVTGTAPAPTVAAPEPTLVQCMGYLGAPIGLYSDGVERATPGCADSPEMQRAARAEGVCGGFYGWMEVSAAEYFDLCGVAPPTDRVPPFTSTPAEDGDYDLYESNDAYSYADPYAGGDSRNPFP